jgi:hypothetical protein
VYLSPSRLILLALAGVMTEDVHACVVKGALQVVRASLIAGAEGWSITLYLSIGTHSCPDLPPLYPCPQHSPSSSGGSQSA